MQANSDTRLCLRRTALRVLSSSPSVSISISSSNTRSITRLTYPIPVRQAQRPAFDFLQRRHYADEAATHSEPEADGATESQHGDNSIAASADADADADTSTSAEIAEESEAASKVESATEKATEQASTAADSVKSAAQTVGEAIAGTAQSLGDAAGFGSQTSKASTDPPDSSNTVYVGNLFFDVRGEDLKEQFAKAGPVTEAKIVNDQRGLSKGFVISFPAHNAYASYWPLLVLCLIDTDSATSHLRPFNPPSAPSTSSICKIMKAVVSPSNSQSPSGPSLVYVVGIAQPRRIDHSTLLPKPSS